MNSNLAPCLMYKAEDFERARLNIDRHAWAADLYGQTRRQASFYLDRDPEDLRAYISDKTPLLTVSCPECGCGPWFAFSLSADGRTLVCNDCGSAWEWDPRDDTEDWNVQAVVRTLRLEHVLKNLPSAGIAYQIEGDARYVSGPAEVIRRFAEVFRGYRINMVNANRWYDGNSAYYGKVHGWKRHDASHLHRVLLCYDLIRDSGVFSTGEIETIDRELVAYARDYLIDGFRYPHLSVEGYQGGDGRSLLLSDPHIQDHGEAWWCIAACGALLKDQDTLQMVVQLFEDMLDPAARIFHGDGTFYECASDYQQGLLHSLSGIPEIIRGNLPVDIYRSPECSLLERCYTWFLDGSYPDGSLPAINDSHVGSRLKPQYAEVAWVRYRNPKALRYLEETWGKDLDGGTDYSLFYRDSDNDRETVSVSYGDGSLHLPDMGLMILRDDREKSDRTMAFLDYGPYVPIAHKHPDYLNIGLYACGRVLLPDNGYNWNPEWARLWERAPSSHNTILELADQPEGGYPLAWCITPCARIAEAGLPGRNSRLIAMFPRPQGPPLVLDIFRVHDRDEPLSWLLHATSGQLDVSGIDALETVAVDHPFRKGQKGHQRGDIRAVWTMAGEQPCGLEVILPEVGPTEVTICECPPEEDVIKEAHREGGTLKVGVELPYRGHVTVARSGSGAVFVAAHSPFEGTTPPGVEIGVHRIEDAADALCVELRAEDQRILFLHNPGAHTVAHSGLTTDGRAAVAVLVDDQLQSLCLAQGTRAAFGETGINRDVAGNGFLERAGGMFKQIEVPGL